MADSSSDYNAEYNGNQLISIAIVFLSLTYFSVSLRVFVRVKITKAFALDDLFILIAQVVFTLSCTCILRGVYYGVGRHNSSLIQSDEIVSLKYQALATLSYVANMMFIKLSIAVFLLRIAVTRPYVWILQISIIVVTIWSTAIFIYSIFQCTPIAAQWDPTIEGAKCVSGSSFVSAAYSISVMSILSDWLYALLPIPMIWSVQMSFQTKITVAFILSLGIFASVATLIRLKYLIELADYSDILYTGTTAMIWTLVEPGVAITAACLVTIRPLLRNLHLPGFESTPTPNNHGGHQPLTLRNDIPEGNWSAISSSTHGMYLKRVSAKSAKDVLKVRPAVHTEMLNDENGSEEDILGIRRTVDIRVVHDRASQMIT